LSDDQSSLIAFLAMLFVLLVVCVIVAVSGAH